MSLAAEAVFEGLDERTRDLLELRERTGAIRRRGWLVRRALLLADLFGLTLAFGIAHAIYTRADNGGTLSGVGELVFFIASLPLWVIAAKVYGLYDKDEERADHSTTDDLVGVFHLITVCTFLLYAVSRQSRWFRPEFGKLFLFWLIACASVVLGRTVARGYCRRKVNYVQNTIILGAGSVGQLVARMLLRHPEYGLNIVGFVDDHPKERDDDLAHVSVIGGVDDIEELVTLLDVERVIVAFSNESSEETLRLIRSLQEREIQVDVVPRLFETVGPNHGLHMIEGLALVSLPPMRLAASSAFLKRAMDICASVLGLLAMAPFLAVLAVAIRLDSPGPVFYRHGRVGRDGRSIRVIKFRTMRREACRGSEYGGEAAEEMFRALISDPTRGREFETSYKFAADPRVTRLGRFLRASSIDELPQLINVLKGELSLVGPRAVTADELERYGDHAAELLAFRPGITGYWQVNGRSRLTYEDRVRLDLGYVTSWSLKLDAQILAKTIRVLVSRTGAV
ncbi:MAG TPA: sugar transferase [Gaiellaceae bacterium]|nr:sugar transferase [Gaiellaceae bacterium]